MAAIVSAGALAGCGGSGSNSDAAQATQNAAAAAPAGVPTVAAQQGGLSLELQGTRSAPSIRYLAGNTAFHFDAAGTPTGIFERPDDAFDRMTLALQAFQKQDAALRPFSSKYDAFLRGNASLTRRRAGAGRYRDRRRDRLPAHARRRFLALNPAPKVDTCPDPHSFTERSFS